MLTVLVGLGLLAAVPGSAGAVGGDPLGQAVEGDAKLQARLKALARGYYIDAGEQAAAEANGWSLTAAKADVARMSAAVDGVGTRWTFGRIAARALPVIGRMGAIGLTAYGAYALWKITLSHSGGGSHVEGLVASGEGAGSDSFFPGSYVSTYIWTRYYSGSSVGANWLLVVGVTPLIDPGVQPTTSSPACSNFNSSNECIDTGVSAVADPAYCTANNLWGLGSSTYPRCSKAPTGSDSVAWQIVRDTQAWDLLRLNPVGSFQASDSRACLGNAGATGQCWRRIATDAEISGVIKLAPTTDAPSASVTARDYTYSQPAGMPTASDLAALEAEVRANTKALGVINHNLADPGDEDWPNPPILDEAEMPDCRGLSVNQCRATLAGQGWTGTLSSVVVDYQTAVLTRGAGNIIYQEPAPGAELDLETDVDVQVNPNPLPVELLRPGVNETYAEYVSRLRARGWVGTYTTTEIEANGDLGPSAVYAVAATVQGNPYTVYTLGPWYALRVAPTTALEFDVNPSDAPPAPDPGEDGDIMPPPPVDDSCVVGDIPAVDLSPLNQDVGDKFPFGIVAWAFTGLSSWVSSASAPSFTLPVLGFEEKEVEVDLAILDPVMPVIRGTILIASTILMFWGLATGLLGLSTLDRGDE